MNENIDLTKILKGCPKGTKLYSISYGDVRFKKITDSKSYPIQAWVDDCHIASFTVDGKIFANCNGECALFPSKDQRDWSKFSAPWLEKQGEGKEEINNFDVRPGLYKCVHRMFDGTPDGKLLFEIGNVYKCISKHDRAEFEVSYGHSIYLEDPVVRKHFIPFESKYEQASSQANERAWLYLVSDVLTWKDGIGQYLDDPRVQELAKILCSKYEQKLYNPSVLSNSSNTGKNEQKFDPKILKPFDKVLTRRGSESYNVWFPDFISDPPNDIDDGILCMCNKDDVTMVIPYNEDTKHLICTNKEAPEYYRYWEY